MAIIKSNVTLPNLQHPIDTFHYIDAPGDELLLKIASLAFGGYVGVINPAGNMAATVDASDVDVEIIDCITGLEVETIQLQPGTGIICGYDSTEPGDAKLFVMSFASSGAIPTGPTLAGDNAFTGNNTFSKALSIGQATLGQHAAQLQQIPVRKKMEVRWSGLVSASLAADTDVDLIPWLLTLGAPTAGALNSFVNTATSKINVYDDDKSVTFKLILNGSWTGAAPRSIQVDFIGAIGNRILTNRAAAVTIDSITLSNPFSIDKGGNIAMNGMKPVVRANGGAYNVVEVVLIIEQLTTETSITPR